MQDDSQMRTALPPPPEMAVAASALFLDFDGTLIPYGHGDITTPVIDAGLLDLLGLLAERSAEAMALVSGRGIAELDGLLAPARFAASGTHGAEYRLRPGGEIRLAHPVAGLERLTALALAWSEAHPGSFVEPKPLTVVLHFHGLPALEAPARAFAAEVLAGFPDLAPQLGRGLIEFKPRGADKGQGIARLMAEPPFRGRRPVFLGDDLADEAGFAAVNAAGGVSVKVGPGATAARYRLDDSHAVRRYLEMLAG